MGRTAWRPHIEDAFILSVSVLRRFGFLDAARATGHVKWTDYQGRELFTASLIAVIEGRSGVLSLSHTYVDSKTRLQKTAEYVIHIEATTPHFGGFQWWFRCPRSGKRAAKLHLFVGSEKFCHRTAMHPQPTYAIQRVSGLRRATHRRWAVRTKLHSADSLLLLTKPKWMRWKTFGRYEEQDIALEDAEMSIARKRWGCP